MLRSVSVMSSLASTSLLMASSFMHLRMSSWCFFFSAFFFSFSAAAILLRGRERVSE